MIFDVLSQRKPPWDSVISAGKQGCSTYLPAAPAAEGAQQNPLPEGHMSLGQAQGAAALSQRWAAAMPRPERVLGTRGTRPAGS